MIEKCSLFSLALVLVLLLNPIRSKADSPLTSTDFYKAYLEVSIVKEAANGNGYITPAQVEYLMGNRPLENKLALINALSWDINGKNNSVMFAKALQKKYEVKYDLELFKKKCDGAELICLAYLKALDNFFEIKQARALSDVAIKKKDDSYCLKLIHGLIKAQALLEHDWCKAYKAVATVRDNKTESADFKADAEAIIFDYMELYKDNCD